MEQGRRGRRAGHPGATGSSLRLLRAARLRAEKPILESVRARMAPAHRSATMALMEKTQKTHPGDVIAIHGHHVGEAERTGEVLEVLGEPGHEHFRVRWQDGHESFFYPSSDAIVRPAHKADRKKP
jgi:Domain of unknown function (DUF1918)